MNAIVELLQKSAAACWKSVFVLDTRYGDSRSDVGADADFSCAHMHRSLSVMPVLSSTAVHAFVEETHRVWTDDRSSQYLTLLIDTTRVSNALHAMLCGIANTGHAEQALVLMDKIAIALCAPLEYKYAAQDGTDRAALAVEVCMWLLESLTTRRDTVLDLAVDALMRLVIVERCAAHIAEHIRHGSSPDHIQWFLKFCGNIEMRLSVCCKRWWSHSASPEIKRCKCIWTPDGRPRTESQKLARLVEKHLRCRASALSSIQVTPLVALDVALDVPQPSLIPLVITGLANIVAQALSTVSSSGEAISIGSSGSAANGAAKPLRSSSVASIPAPMPSSASAPTSASLLPMTLPDSETSEQSKSVHTDGITWHTLDPHTSVVMRLWKQAASSPRDKDAVMSLLRRGGLTKPTGTDTEILLEFLCLESLHAERWANACVLMNSIVLWRVPQWARIVQERVMSPLPEQLRLATEIWAQSSHWIMMPTRIAPTIIRYCSSIEWRCLRQDSRASRHPLVPNIRKLGRRLLFLLRNKSRGIFRQVLELLHLLRQDRHAEPFHSFMIDVFCRHYRRVLLIGSDARVFNKNASNKNTDIKIPQAAIGYQLYNMTKLFLALSVDFDTRIFKPDILQAIEHHVNAVCRGDASRPTDALIVARFLRGHPNRATAISRMFACLRPDSDDVFHKCITCFRQRSDRDSKHSKSMPPSPSHPPPPPPPAEEMRSWGNTRPFVLGDAVVSLLLESYSRSNDATSWSRTVSSLLQQPERIVPPKLCASAVTTPVQSPPVRQRNISIPPSSLSLLSTPPKPSSGKKRKSIRSDVIRVKRAARH